MKNIDPALLRKGRLISKYEFQPLATEKAKVLLEDLGFKDCDVKKPMSLSDIFYYGDESYETIRKSII
jgi:hypothetical protein